MMQFAIWWSDALLRASIQGALWALVVFATFNLWKSAPANLKVWAWRIVLLKFIFVLVAPIPIEKGRAAMSTGSAVPSLLPLFILALSVSVLAICLATLVVDLRKIIRLRKLPATPLVQWSRAGYEVKESVGITVPVLLGFGKPLILVPKGLASESPEEFRMALAHELAHLRRKDLAWAWLAFAAKSILGFHPLVQLAAKELHIATETACDEEALGQIDGCRATYGRLLLRLSQKRSKLPDASGAMPSLAFASSISKDTIKRRITSLAEPSKPTSKLAWFALITASLLALPGYRVVAKDAPISNVSTSVAPAASPAAPAALFSPGASPR